MGKYIPLIYQHPEVNNFNTRHYNMKIGVVTYVRTDNYGAELQGYALQGCLGLMGHEAEVLDIDKKDIDSATFREMAKAAIIKRLKRNPIDGIRQIFSIGFHMITGRLLRRTPSYIEQSRQTSRENAFKEFWENAINHSEHIPLENLDSTPMEYEALIAGSDQIWNYTRTSYLNPYFLTFAKDGVRKLSYAASFSVSSIPPNRQEQYRELINNIPQISVRENEGAELVRQLTGRECQVVLDPTLLLDREEWLKVASDRIKIDEPYILTYSLNSSKGYWKIVNGYAKKYGLRVVNLRHDFNDCKIPPHQTDIFDAGPREFIYLLANAKLVITNSFHGTIFSINFGVPFLSVLNRASETNSRIDSILKNLGLLDRKLYDDEIDLTKSIQSYSDKYAQALGHLRDESKAFLTNNLS